MKIPGVILKTELPTVEPDPRRRSALLRNGTIRPVGQWYVTAEAPEDLVKVLKHDVRPTCLDAASLHGLWTPPGSGVHVYRPRAVVAEQPGPQLVPIRRRVDPETGELVPLAKAGSSSGAAKPASLVLHKPRMRAWDSADPVPELELILEHAAHCLPVVKSAILIESALNQGKLGQAELGRLLTRLPKRLRVPLERVRDDAQSGTETTVRWWLESRSVAVRSQVQLLPSVRVDLLIGTNWVIECDSRTYHDNPEQYMKDRQRDLALSARGYRVTRLTWEQVFRDWANTTRMLTVMLHRREHRRALPV